MDDGQYYTAAFNWAYEEGLITGDTSVPVRTARPLDPASRQEASAMVWRFAGIMGCDTSVEGLPDPGAADWGAVDEWARDAVKWTVARGILGKVEVGGGAYEVRPHDPLLRSHLAKVATVLHRDYV